MRFVAVGDVFVDVVCAASPGPGERAHADVSLRAGGSAVNAALTAAELGASAGMVGRIGADPAGELVAASLATAGVAGHLARDEELHTGVAVVLLGPGGASVVADRGANAGLSTADVPEPLDADVLFVSGFALFQTGSDRAAQAALEGFRGSWAGVDLASPGLAAKVDLDAVARVAKVLFATAAEAKAVTGAEPEEAVRALAERFTVGCVKLGPEGALAAQGDVVERRAAPLVERRSPFGAGDAFAAAFLLALAGGDSLGGALQRACEAGARSAAGP